MFTLSLKHSFEMYLVTKQSKKCDFTRNDKISNHKILQLAPRALSKYINFLGIGEIKVLIKREKKYSMLL